MGSVPGRRSRLEYLYFRTAGHPPGGGQRDQLNSGLLYADDDRGHCRVPRGQVLFHVTAGNLCRHGDFALLRGNLRSDLLGRGAADIRDRDPDGGRRRRGSVLRMMLVRAAVGARIGLIAAGALPRGMSGMLSGMSAHDPLTYLGTTALFIFVAVAACLVPARRPTRMDRVIALRYDLPGSTLHDHQPSRAKAVPGMCAIAGRTDSGRRSPIARANLRDDRAPSPAGHFLIYTTHYMVEAERLCDRISGRDGQDCTQRGNVRRIASALSHVAVPKPHHQRGESHAKAHPGRKQLENVHVVISRKPRALGQVDEPDRANDEREEYG